MPEIHRQKEWQNLKKLGLCPEINSFADYVDGVMLGEARAGLLTLVDSQKFPSPKYIRDLHRAMFVDVHPWAGKFNEEGEDVWFGGMLSCDPRFIISELDRLRTDTVLLAKSKSDAAQCRAIAFFHVKFERIHPFKDGNGRVGRALLDSQRNAFFGIRDRRKPIESHEYRVALMKAQRKSNLRPFINLLLKAEQKPPLPEVHEQLPFLLKPYQGTVEEKKKRRRAAKNFEW